WVNSGGTRLTLKGDGNALIEYTNSSVEGTWSFEDPHLVVSYQLYGDRTLEYDLARKEGWWTLSNADGGLMLRSAEYEKAMAAASEAVDAYRMEAGEEIVLPFVRFTLNDAALVDTVGSESHWVDAAQGCRFFCVKGTVENLYNEELEFARARAQFTFNGNYLFSGNVRLLTEETLKTKLSPMGKGELFIYASVPEEMARSLRSASVLFAFNENLAVAPLFAPDGEYRFQLDLDEAAVSAALQEPERERVTFEECPALPTPLSYANVRESGHSSGTINGKVTHINYSYVARKSGDDIQTLLEGYLEGLRGEGFAVEDRDGRYGVLHGTTPVAALNVEGDAIKMELTPGNESLTGAPAPAGVEEASAVEEGASGPAPSAAPVPEREYTDRETVKKVQQALNDAGFNCGKPDGMAGKNTKKAIGDFQEANGLARTGTITDSLLIALGLAEAPPADKAAEAETGEVVDTDAGTLIIKGYAMDPGGFKGFSNTDAYDGYSIFTVHAVLTVKGGAPKSSWSTFHTQAFQNGVEARSHTDFDKDPLITTDILPNTPVAIDLDFLVESSDAPITFMVSTWGRSKIVFREEVDPAKLPGQ
ncbi:MAG: peptidoglycan-binding protein, partial [Clostridia bacterium]|nr:peptidoglycan-binding protein [Clostridia bacterium]